MTQEIFKVQLPITSTDPNPSALIYNEDRSFYELPHRSLVEHLFGENEVKIFVYGELIDNALHLEDRAPYQEW